MNFNYQNIKISKKCKWAGSKEELEKHINQRDCEILENNKAYTKVKKLLVENQFGFGGMKSDKIVKYFQNNFKEIITEDTVIQA
jgi:hypothetical protein